ncbi:RNA polymerase-associated protein RTF1 [Heracleum sosnowskyi]|uniref:RNA polymerase-associated protein RTF1 n=1 Tax=Heracleum sosnowskyi TaxID=360622 RepID=A0AAD8HFE7_9APIA|nr:RNA polymerase-associated protein RTF1 [Heracleum sosnowskyi]KAK1366159.1 RNA polymerase-associated protein RTF1 [Heracleum sosnowskyi]
MEDLEKLLLEAAGRTGPSGRKRQSPPSSRRRREGSYSDNGSDSRDDDSDDDRRYASRKRSASQVPLKKRLKHHSERDFGQRRREEGDDGYDRAVDSDDDSIGSDLYKDEDDRRKLAQMTELEREMILTERSTKITDKKMQEKLRMQKEKMNQSRKSSPPHVSSRTGIRSSARSADRAAAKAVSSSSQSGSGSRSEDDGSTGFGRLGYSDDENTSPKPAIPTFEDVKAITIKRSKLAKWHMEPFFDDLIVGCFVRVGVAKSKNGPIYRLSVVKNVDSSNPERQYKLDNMITHKYLNVVWGHENSAARWQMAMISESPPSQAEFDQWVEEVERSGGRMPSKQDVLDKKEAIQKTSTYVYSAATVKQMLREKKSATVRPLNVAAEKDRLRREMDVAISKNDEAEVERINARLLELEASRRTHEKDHKAIKLEEMNRKNRVDNFKNASGLKSASGLKAGDAGYDPFSRRWTRSRNYYVPKASGGDQAATAENCEQNAVLGGPDGSGAGAGVVTEAGAVATAAALVAAADAGKLVDTSAPVDQGTESNMLHNFELPISLDLLQKFGGAQGAQAGFMARKQRIEATVGCRVPENDGRRHAQTLTISDYKRRRGLL